ncbi:uncharacterized protein [Amphiura filiformis]|uniref:uncharacterized protein n=1 Tax=Amphiura filiformis TaxID=82378 RepID=UPI003B223C98
MSSSCLDVEAIFPADLFAIDALEVSLATIFGLLLGIIIALICSKCFFRELAKERIQKSEEGLEVNHDRYEPIYPNRKPKKAAKLAVESESTPMKKLKKQASSISLAQEDSDARIESYDADRQDQYNDTLICALIQTNLEKTQIELNLQDFRCTHTMEEELAQERSSVLLLLLQILLGKFVAKGKLDENSAEEFVQQCTQESLGKFVAKGKLDENSAEEFVQQCTQTIHEAEASVTAEHQAAIDELKKDTALSKDPLKLQEAIEKKWPEYQRNMASIVQNAQIGLQDDLKKDSSLSDEEIDALVTKLMENMATAEAMIGQEAVRQSLMLQERLAKRQALSEQYMSVGSTEQKSNIFRVQDLKESATSLCESKDITEAQVQSIMKQYEEDLARVQENHQAEVFRNSQQLAEKLQQHRQRRLHQLERQQLEEKQQLMEAAMKAVNPADFVQAHHDLLEQQRNARNDLIDELDYHEAEELSTMRKQLEETRTESVDQQEDSFFETVKEQARLDKKEASKMLRKHAANVKEFEGILDKQRKNQHAELQERIETRKTQWEQEWQKAQVEQKQLTEQQEKTVSKLLESQGGLDVDAREKIMLQHEQDTRVLNNHLQMTRLRHQKVVEAKLAKRRARVTMLKEKQEMELVGKGDATEKELEKMEKEHEEQQKLEEQDIAEAEEKAMLELRSLLAKETDIAIKGQDMRLSAVIAKLQVGQARRQAIIKEQDKALKELQEQMVDSVADSKTLSERRTEKIMEEHFEHLAAIRSKISLAKDQQAQVLAQKIDAIKMTKERSILGKLEEEKKERQSTLKSTPYGSRKIKASALTVLNKILEDNRHKQEMDKMEQEMKLEMAKQKEELNSQLGEAMEKELQEHEKNFLGQLAAVSKMSKEDLNEMIHNAVEEGGGDESEAKKISKDLNQRIKSAKARPEFYEEEQDEGSEQEEKPKKRKKKKKKPVESDED